MELSLDTEADVCLVSEDGVQMMCVRFQRKPPPPLRDVIKANGGYHRRLAGGSGWLVPMDRVSALYGALPEAAVRLRRDVQAYVPSTPPRTPSATRPALGMTADTRPAKRPRGGCDACLMELRMLRFGVGCARLHIEHTCGF